MVKRNRSVTHKPVKTRQALTLTHPNAAGIDIGSASHFVAVPPERDEEPVREFPSFTADLEAIAGDREIEAHMQVLQVHDGDPAKSKSWLGQRPGTKITAGKSISGKTKRCANRAAQVLRLAAAAHKLARLIYTLLTKGEEYTDRGQHYCQER